MDETFCGKHKGRKVECGECEMLLAVGLLASHQATQHDIYESFVLEEEGESAPLSPRRWDTAFFPEEGCYRLIVPACPQGREGYGARDSWNLRWYFAYRHSEDRLMVGGCVCYQKCRLCGMQVSTTDKPTHESSNTCMQMTAAHRHHAVAAQEMPPYVNPSPHTYDKSLKAVRQFKYLGRIVPYDDNDTPAVRGNIKRAPRVWGQFQRLLKKEKVPPRVARMFYQAVVASVLLYGSETWVLPPPPTSPWRSSAWRPHAGSQEYAQGRSRGSGSIPTPLMFWQRHIYSPPSIISGSAATLWCKP